VITLLRAAARRLPWRAKKNETRQRSETRAACARERENTSRAAAVYKAPQLPAVLLARAARLQKKRELKTQVLEQRDETAAMEMAAKRAMSPCEFTRCAGRRKQLERPYQLLVTVPTSTATLVVQLPNGRGNKTVSDLICAVAARSKVALEDVYVTYGTKILDKSRKLRDYSQATRLGRSRWQVANLSSNLSINCQATYLQHVYNLLTTCQASCSKPVK
jgi:hypothetical protein